MNSVDYVASILKQEGVSWMSCYPSNPLIEAVAKEGIRPVAFRHERGAIMAADGYSRISDRRRFGVVAVQSQAGAENSMGGLAQANADNVPILALPGGNPLDMFFVRPNFVAARTWAPVLKHVEVITRPDQTGNVMRRAFHALRSGRPGPVLVEMPGDVCMASIPEGAPGYASPTPALYAPAAGAVADAARKLVDAKEPLIWAGAGVMSAGATEQLRVLAELLDAPVYTSMPGKSAFDERHPLSVGAGGSPRWPGRRASGSMTATCCSPWALPSPRRPTASAFPGTRFLIHSVIADEEINKDTAADIGLVGDAGLALDAVIDAVRGLIGEAGRDTGVKARIKAARDAWLAQWRPYFESTTTARCRPTASSTR